MYDDFVDLTQDSDVSITPPLSPAVPFPEVSPIPMTPPLDDEPLRHASPIETVMMRFLSIKKIYGEPIAAGLKTFEVRITNILKHCDDVLIGLQTSKTVPNLDEVTFVEEIYDRLGYDHTDLPNLEGGTIEYVLHIGKSSVVGDGNMSQDVFENNAFVSFADVSTHYKTEIKGVYKLCSAIEARGNVMLIEVDIPIDMFPVEVPRDLIQRTHAREMSRRGIVSL